MKASSPARAALVPAIAVAALLLGGCSSPGASRVAPRISLTPVAPLVSIGVTPASPAATPAPTATSPAVTGISPGHGSPAQAYAGFLDAAVEGQVATECSYVLPSQQPTCPAIMNGSSTTIEGPPVRIGTVDIVGSQALVVPVGTVCQNGTCLPNSNPDAGIPSSAAGFTDAYNQATQTGTDPDAGCGEVAGQWYLDLGGTPSINPVI
jgi:hypothetical protein